MPLLTALIFVPLVGAGLLFLPRGGRAWRVLGVGTSGLVLALAIVIAVRFDWRSGVLQFEERAPWIPALGASYHLGLDGLSLPLVLLTALLTFLALLYSWHEERREFFALFLAMETGLIGVFATLDLLLFYFFFCFFLFLSTLINNC